VIICLYLPLLPRRNVHTNSWHRAYSPAIGGEGAVGDAAGAAYGFDIEAALDSVQSVPEVNPASRHDGDDDDMQVIDQISGKELADD
jgi:hypothetical protein